MPQIQRQKDFNKGYVLFEPSHFTYVFKFLGNTYTTNLKRNKPYKFDYPSWKKANTQGIIYKLKMILTKKVKRIEIEIKDTTDNNLNVIGINGK